MQIKTKSLATLLQDMAASAQGAAEQYLDLSVGSVFRAVFQATASMALWLQWSALSILSITRAATSTGTDLDTWMADYSFTRLPAVAATGALTFGRYAAGIQALIPLNTLTKTADGILTFMVIADPTNPAWDGVGNYVMGASITQLTVPAIAAAPGSASNVTAGSVSIIASSLPGIDFVTNALGFAGGIDAEPDTAFRARFQLYINSRSAATNTAILNAIYGVRQGIRANVIENLSALGQFSPGTFCVIADEGNGLLSTEVAADIAAAIEAVRPIGATYSLQAPGSIPLSISFNAILRDGVASAPIIATASGLISEWIDSLPIGATAAISKIESLVHSADASVISVQDMIMNGNTTDIVAGWDEVFILNSITGN